MSSDLLRTSPTNYQTIGERFQRSHSPLFSRDIARRIRAAITPPRSRRALDSDVRPRSATTSPCLTTATELIGGMPQRQKTASCGDLGRLEQIFEPRRAPYTPPLRVRRGLCLEDRSSSLRGMSEADIEKLETKLFEPRDTACTPPLKRKEFKKSSSHDEATTDERRMRKIDSERSVESWSSADSVDNEMVNDLQKMVFQLRSKAKVSSQEAVEQLSHLQQSPPDKADEVTIRQLAQLQHERVATQQPRVVSCC